MILALGQSFVFTLLFDYKRSQSVLHWYLFATHDFLSFSLSHFCGKYNKSALQENLCILCPNDIYLLNAKLDEEKENKPLVLLLSGLRASKSIPWNNKREQYFIFQLPNDENYATSSKITPSLQNPCGIWCIYI